MGRAYRDHGGRFAAELHLPGLPHPDLIRRAALALGVGFPLAMLVVAGGALLGEWTGLIDVGVVGSLKQMDFIYQVGRTEDGRSTDRSLSRPRHVISCSPAVSPNG